jgi:hypothetical protein
MLNNLSTNLGAGEIASTEEIKLSNDICNALDTIDDKNENEIIDEYILGQISDIEMALNEINK